MDLYRRCNVIEQLLSIIASPAIPDACLEKIVDFVYRCTYVDGSSAIITRYGLISWLASRSKGPSRERIGCLAERAYETSDQVRIDEWSHRTMKDLLDNFRGVE